MKSVRSHPEQHAKSRGSEHEGLKGLQSWEIDWDKPDHDEAVAFIDEQYTDGKMRRQHWEGQAAECLAYAAGEQNVRWNTDMNSLVEKFRDLHVPDRYRQRLSINTIKGYVLHRMSLLLGVPITWNVLPWSAEDRDVATARMGSKLAEYAWGNANPHFEMELIDALWAMFCTGVIFAKVWWDPELGADQIFYPPKGAGSAAERVKSWMGTIAKRLGRDDTDVPLTDDGGFLTQIGDNRVEWCTGFEITEPVYCRRLSKARWVIHSTFVEKERLIERFGNKARDLSPDAANVAYQSGYDRMYGFERRDSIGDTPSRNLSEMIQVHELWRPRSVLNRKGCFIVVADKTVLHSGPNPYRHGRLPFVEFRELPDDRFRPTSTVRMLLDLQDSRNRNRQKIAEYVNRVTDPTIMVEDGANLPENAFTEGPSIVPVAENGIAKVRAFEMPNLPPAALHLDQAYEQDMQTVAGVHDSSLGRMESRQQSGRHAQLLQESDQRGNTVTRKLIQMGLGQVGHLVLWNYHQYATRKRMVQIGGTYAEREVVAFKGEDLLPKKRGDEAGPYTFNVTVNIGVETSVEAMLEKVEFMIKSGLLDPKNPDDRLTITAMIGDKIVRDDKATRQRSRAEQENRDLVAKRMPVLARGDDDFIHIEEHEKFTTSPEYRDALRRNPNLATLFEAHIREHMFQEAEKRLRPGLIEEEVKQDLLVEYAHLGLNPQAGGQAGPGVTGATAGQGSPTMQNTPQAAPNGPPGGLKMAM